MTQDIQSQVSGLIPQIHAIDIAKSKAQTAMLEYEEEYKQTEAYKNYIQARGMIAEYETKEAELREQGKELMIVNCLHDFTTLDGTTVQLNKTPGSLVVEKEAEKYIPEEYWKVKKEIDKTKLKKAVTEGQFYNDGVSISVDYKLVIKSK